MRLQSAAEEQSLLLAKWQREIYGGSFGTAKGREKYKQAGFAESFVKLVDVKQVVSAISRVMAKTNRAA